MKLFSSSSPLLNLDAFRVWIPLYPMEKLALSEWSVPS